jgi:hypothetical protein
MADESYGRAKITYEPPDLIKRMEAYPRTLDGETKTAHEEAKRVLRASVPGYAPKPAGSTYIRTGDLGAGLGSSMSGGATGGMPTIYNTRRLGVGAYISEVGSSTPYYNEYVIGEGRQAWMHQGRWWTEVKWLAMATEGIIKVFDKMTERLAQFLDGKR